MAANNWPTNAYIAKEDLKKTYRQPPQVGLHRIRAYCKSIEGMEMLGITQIEVEKTVNDTIKFTIFAESTKEAKQAKKYIQGAFCHESAIGKYDEPDLPERNVKGISGTSEAQKQLSDGDQRKLQSEGKQFLLTVEALQKHDIQHMQGPCELRQFGCGRCKQAWWRTVLKSKPVSRCKNCQQRYDALPRNKEFGIGRYTCTKPSCGRKFFANCEATDCLRCRKCKTVVSNPYIHPRWKKAARVRRKRLNPGAATFVPKPPPPHKCDREYDRGSGGPEFYPPSGVYPTRPTTDQIPSLDGLFISPPQAPRQPPPTPRRRRIFNASMPHDSTGSTNSTFLTQMNEAGEEVDLDYDIDEEEVTVGPCRFECECGNRYTVVCELNKDTAECYECRRENPPLGWARGDLSVNETGYKHSCSKCKGIDIGNCPNIIASRYH